MTPYGTVNIAGKTFIEREQTFPLEVSMTSGLVVRGNLQLPGIADFWLKSLSRVTVTSDKRFKFRLGNTDGSTWYQSGGTGGTTDRVVDPLIFGTGQFPFVLCPYIYYPASGGIMYEIEDISSSSYTLYIAFRGAFLMPSTA